LIVLALDALDQNLVKAFNCKNLMQEEYGQTDISEFDQPRTIVLWASFLTGRKMETKIPIKGQWEFQLKREETFIQFFNTPKVIDIPAFSYKQENHKEERRLLKAYFKENATINEYDKLIWRNHEENKKEFLNSLEHHDLLIGYFNLADAIGHLSFGVLTKMKEVYEELENLAEEVEDADDSILIISDHGMKAIGRYGDHTKKGYYSANTKLNLNLPKITDFHKIIKRARNESSKS
jgi:hypothetical protein